MKWIPGPFLSFSFFFSSREIEELPTVDSGEFLFRNESTTFVYIPLLSVLCVPVRVCLCSFILCVCVCARAHVCMYTYLCVRSWFHETINNSQIGTECPFATLDRRVLWTGSSSRIGGAFPQAAKS